MHDLQLIAILDQNLRQRRPRHDREIALDRDLFGREAEIGGEVGKAQSGAHAAMLAIDLDREGSVGMHHIPMPFVSSEVETPRTGVSTSLDTNG